LATRDVDAILALDADCICYTAAADVRPMEAVDDICRILRSGKSVVSSSVVSLVHPGNLGPAVHEKLEDACAQGSASFFTSGIDPGFANDVLPLTLSGLCERWDTIRVQEIVNYATYDQPDVVFGIMGFGHPVDAEPILLKPGVLSSGWGGTIRLLAQGLDVELDDIREVHERRAADEAFDTPIGRVEKGTTEALRFEVQGIVGGRPRLIVEHVTRLRDDAAPDWPQGDGGYRVIIEGVPRMTRHGRREGGSRRRGRHSHGHAPGERHPLGLCGTARCALRAGSSAGHGPWPDELIDAGRLPKARTFEPWNSSVGKSRRVDPLSPCPGRRGLAAHGSP
jgi:4-hydroxy-tetrahydrodipicolinate reductase